jgi:hypothetical protein
MAFGGYSSFAVYASELQFCGADDGNRTRVFSLGSCFLPDALAGVALHFACGTALLATRLVHRRALCHIHAALVWWAPVVLRRH